MRDAQGAFKRQAARFRIFQYPDANAGSYPTGLGTEIKIGSTVNGKTVENIIWTVHVANKKANTYVLVEDPPNAGIASYENGKLPPLRNASVQNGDPNDPRRVTMLTIDPGPRTVSGANSGGVKFDKATIASVYRAGSGIVQLNNYPKSFPADSFANLYCPTGPIDTLGELRTDAGGSLLVLGGYGRACGWDVRPPYLVHDVNNDQWFGDASDGPVSAVLVFNDNSVQQVQAGAWVTATDPGYAPQTLNIVSLWDDIYDSWVRTLALVPALYSNGGFQPSYRPAFSDQLQPIFVSVSLQQWNINLNSGGIGAHNQVGQINATTDPSTTIVVPITGTVRNPNDPADWSQGPPLMPGSLGDSNQDFLVVSKTQYFFLQQWQNNNFAQGAGPALGPGEYLDKVVLQNCLGGRFSPGIDLTFVMRDPDLCSASSRNRLPMTPSKRACPCSPKATFPCTPAMRASSPATSASSWRSPGTPTTIPARRIRRRTVPMRTQRYSGRGRPSARLPFTRRNSIRRGRRACSFGPFAGPGRRHPTRRIGAATRTASTSS